MSCPDDRRYRGGRSGPGDRVDVRARSFRSSAPLTSHSAGSRGGTRPRTTAGGALHTLPLQRCTTPRWEGKCQRQRLRAGTPRAPAWRKCPLLGELGHYDRVAAARASKVSKVSRTARKSSQVSRASTRGGHGDDRARRAGRVVGRALRRPFTGAARGVRRATHAHGAGESGLGKLIELHAVNSAGDVMITIALASTVFFSVPTDEARGRVALYLAVTMAPFALLAPVIGPLLDRVPHGRRAAMAGAMLARALLALTMSGAVATGGLELYPAALGVLVASKAYGVVRSAVVPRLLPPRISLVKANSRVTLAGLLATGVAAPIGRRAAHARAELAAVRGVCGVRRRHGPVVLAAAQGRLGEGRAPGPAGVPGGLRALGGHRAEAGAAYGRPVGAARPSGQCLSAGALRFPDVLPGLPAARASAGRAGRGGLAGAGGGGGRDRQCAGDGGGRLAEGPRA